MTDDWYWGPDPKKWPWTVRVADWFLGLFSKKYGKRSRR